MQKWCIIFLLFVLASCKTRKEVATTTPAVVQPQPKDSVIETMLAAPEVKKQFRLSVLLALNAQQYFEKDSSGNYSMSEMETLNHTALEFYEGILTAAKNQESLIKLNVVDVAIDSLKIVKLLKDSSIIKSDLVISMAGPAVNNMVLKAAAAREFPILSPVSVNSNLVNTYNKIWAVNPSNKTQCRRMTAYLKNHYPDASYSVIYRSDVKKEADLSDLFNGELHLLFNDTLARMINYAPDGWAKLQKNLKTGKRNILIIPSSDESFLTALLTKLNTHEEFSFLVVGLPTWEHFESIDHSLLETLNTHIFNTTFLDYENEQVKHFRKQFIEEYHADPVFAAYTGYDIFKWIDTNFNRFGNHLEKYESVKSLTAPNAGFDFLQNCENCSFENQYISVLVFKDGTLKRADQ